MLPCSSFPLFIWGLEWRTCSLKVPYNLGRCDSNGLWKGCTCEPVNRKRVVNIQFVQETHCADQQLSWEGAGPGWELLQNETTAGKRRGVNWDCALVIWRFQAPREGVLEVQVEGQGKANKSLLQRYNARTSPPSSQKYDTILKRENMFLCGQTAESVVCTCRSVCYFF